MEYLLGFVIGVILIFVLWWFFWRPRDVDVYEGDHRLSADLDIWEDEDGNLEFDFSKPSAKPELIAELKKIESELLEMHKRMVEENRMHPKRPEDQ